MYCFRGRVRYSEVNMEKRLTLSSLMDYLQDCCTFQSEDMKIGVDYLGKKHAAWVLSSWEIVINDFPALGEQISVNTWPYDFKGFYGWRNFTVEDLEGKRKAFANSVWVYMDTDTMRPVKIAEEVLNAYLPEFEPAISYDWSERKIRYNGAGTKKEPVRVQRFHIDTNHHMNNGKYILAAEEYLPAGFLTGRVRAEYKKAARLGDLLYPVVYEEENGITVVLGDEEEKPYAVVSFIGEDKC